MRCSRCTQTCNYNASCILNLFTPSRKSLYFAAMVNLTIVTSNPVDVTRDSTDNEIQGRHVVTTNSPIGSVPGVTDSHFQELSNALQLAQNVVRYLCFAFSIVKIAAFARKSMRDNASGKFLLTMNISQCIRLSFTILHSIVNLLMTDPERLYIYYLFVLYGPTNLSNIIYRACLFIACLMSSERLYAVTRPLHIKQFILARRPLLFIAATFLLTGCYHIYFSLQYTFYLSPGINGTKIVVLGYTDWYFRNRDIVDGFSSAGKFIFIFVPLVWISVFNVLVVHFLRRHRDDRKAIKSTADVETTSRRDRQMTLTILACTAGYVIFIVPGAIHFLALAVVPEYNYTGKGAKLVQLMDRAQDICLQVSYMSDFLSFLLLSKAFRDSLVSLFICKKVHRGKERTRSSEHTSDMTSLSS
ncbi:uncharacterized protein LOC112561561 [Pomacea canaliculata]|uniref:uncharacterized protein LOC112561561 n=1 Tax=Pomacea canaliculata TaxID=400727 RepID=UPI000D7304B3|nr:uncharacterized protein LOC112561561 [Pomacea canaliculata]